MLVDYYRSKNEAEQPISHSGFLGKDFGRKEPSTSDFREPKVSSFDKKPSSSLADENNPYASYFEKPKTENVG